MTIQVTKVQRATLQFNRDSTVLDLLQALTENLGGEWDDARLDVSPGGPTGTTFDDGWKLIARIDTDEPNRAERWETEDGKHVATETSLHEGSQTVRRCSCGVVGTETEIATHLTSVSRGAWRTNEAP